MQFQTKKAGALTLQPVNRQAMLDIIVDLGGVDFLLRMQEADTPAQSLNKDDVPALFQGSNRMLLYAFGWGVVDDPPADALETLALLGKPTHLKEIARANWLRYLVLDERESSALLAQIMALSFSERDDGD